MIGGSFRTLFVILVILSSCILGFIVDFSDLNFALESVSRL